MSCIRHHFFCFAALAAFATGASAQAGGNADRGSSLFASDCSECHSVREGKDKKGPSLYGIYGAKAGQRPGFKYSETMLNSQIVWDAEKLSSYLANPRAVVPNGKMKPEAAVSDARERADLIAFLATQGHR
ncbi:MAG: c-type cytochrome [Burkholderiaceae bacterium]|jgi:cytochrome c|nr:c-type cytochrome [Burkholderiaceae bacterium]